MHSAAQSLLATQPTKTRGLLRMIVTCSAAPHHKDFFLDHRLSALAPSQGLWPACLQAADLRGVRAVKCVKGERRIRCSNLPLPFVGE